jgi:hypothetical protein
MHQHTGDMPERSFVVTLYGAGGTHEIQVNSPCACGMAEFVRDLPDLPFIPEFLTIKELARTGE